MKGSVFVGVSLDGFIARTNGDLDWLPQDTGGDDLGYDAFVATVDALVVGRGTFDKVLTFDTWPYGERSASSSASSCSTSLIMNPNLLTALCSRPFQQIDHQFHAYAPRWYPLGASCPGRCRPLHTAAFIGFCRRASVACGAFQEPRGR